VTSIEDWDLGLGESQVIAQCVGDRDMRDASPLVSEDHQHEQQAIRSGRDHEEVGGHHLADVVREECSPRLRRWPRAIESANGATGQFLFRFDKLGNMN